MIFRRETASGGSESFQYVPFSFNNSVLTIYCHQVPLQVEHEAQAQMDSAYMPVTSFRVASQEGRCAHTRVLVTCQLCSQC